MHFLDLKLRLLAGQLLGGQQPKSAHALLPIHQTFHLEVFPLVQTYRASLIYPGAKAYLYGGFLKWWYPQNTSKWSCLVGKPMVVGETHHLRKPPYGYVCSLFRYPPHPSVFSAPWNLTNPRRDPRGFLKWLDRRFHAQKALQKKEHINREMDDLGPQKNGGLPK